MADDSLPKEFDTIILGTGLLAPPPVTQTSKSSQVISEVWSTVVCTQSQCTEEWREDLPLQCINDDVHLVT